MIWVKSWGRKGVGWAVNAYNWLGLDRADNNTYCGVNKESLY